VKLITLTQGSPEWHEWRLGGFGGSDANVLMGVSPYATVADLIIEKVTGLGREVNRFATAYGHKHEPDAREMYCLDQQIGLHECEPCCAEHDEFPWMRASFDGLRQDRTVQVKCFKPEKHAIICKGESPDDIYPQLQWEMMVAGVRLCDLVGYSLDKKLDTPLAVAKVKADDAYQRKLLATAREVWEEITQRRNG
jgi:putative phage-type endonuclease